MSGKLIGETGRLRINVSGQKYEILRASLLQHPETRLGQIVASDDVRADLCDAYDPMTEEYFFQRCPDVFLLILGYYRTGVLHLNDIGYRCMSDMLDELAYWKVTLKNISKCCGAIETYTRLSKLHSENPVIKNPTTRNEKLKARIRSIMNDPWGSAEGIIFASVSTMVVVLSTALIILSSYEKFRPIHDRNIPANMTFSDEQYLKRRAANSYIINSIASATVAWFILEFFLALYSASNRLKFMYAPLTITDLMSIIPFIIQRILSLVANTTPELLYAERVCSALRLLRITQFAKVITYSAEGKMLFKILWDTRRELLILSSTVLVVNIMLATLVYFVEGVHDDSKFDNILISLYYVFITVSTVGYGDYCPTTPAGQVIACLLVVFAMCILALPASVLVSKFTQLLAESKQDEAIEKVLAKHRLRVESRSDSHELFTLLEPKASQSDE